MQQRTQLLSHIDFNDCTGRLFGRIPKQLKEALVQSAKRSGRPINSELKIRLAHSLNNIEFVDGVPNWQEQ